MDLKKVVFGLFALSLVGLGVGFILGRFAGFGFCQSSDTACIDLMIRIGLPLIYSSGALAVVFFVLLIVPAAWHTWKWVALWYMPFAAELFIFYKAGTYDPYPETVFRWLAILYVLISLIVIGVSAWRHRHDGYMPIQRSWSKTKKATFWGAWIVWVGVIYFPHVHMLLRYMTG